MQRPSFLEFFCGGGMARAGLGPDWRCALANDFDAKKAASYAENWGSDVLRIADVASLRDVDLPGCADLAWASFPCQDLSVAGSGAGLNGQRSGAFWSFFRLMESLAKRQRAPGIIVLENVLGAITANGGGDFASLCRALRSLNYVTGALTLNAAHFTPQSRPRLFIIAAHLESGALDTFSAPGPSSDFATPALVRAAANLQSELAHHWRWWRLPAPPRRNFDLADIVEDDPLDAPWHSVATTRRFLEQMSPPSLAKIAAAHVVGKACIGALFRRTRSDAQGHSQVRAEARFDGLAGCLRTPGGGSSRQFLIAVRGSSIRTRLFSAREAARLMGLPDSYRLPLKRNDAYHLLGDGVAPPAVRFLSDHLLRPLVEAAARAKGQAA